MSTSIVGQGERPSRSLYDVFCLYCDDGEVVPSRDAVIHGNITSVGLQLHHSSNVTEDDWKRVGIGKPPACVPYIAHLFISHLY